MLRAAIYARISSDREGEGLGVARQLEDCARKAAENGWHVGDRYVDDDVSAYSGRPRPEYRRLLADAGRRIVDLYEASGQPAEATAWRAKLGLPQREPAPPPRSVGSSGTN